MADDLQHPDSPPAMSVVIPALDEQALIGTCLTSLAQQDYRGRVEIIVVDNGSTDATADVARRHGALVVHEPRRGVCQARQRGTEAASGEIVVSTDADTTFDPSWLTRIAAAMDDDSGFVATCGPCRYADAPRWAHRYTGTLFGVTSWIYRRTGRVAYASATNIAFRRSAWTGYDLRLTQGGDELGLLRSLRRAGRVHFDVDRVTSTSPRRLRHGLLYNALVTCLFFYLAAYLVNTAVGRPVIGAAPAFRDDRVRSAPMRFVRRRRSVGVAALVLAGLLTYRLTGTDLV